MLHVGTTVRPGENINFSLDDKGEMYINATGSDDAMRAFMEWENIKASRAYDKEVWTGKMAGNKKVYGKVVDMGTLPNQTIKDIDHKVNGLDRFLHCTGEAWLTSDPSAVKTLPAVHTSTTHPISLWVDSAAPYLIRATTGVNRLDHSAAAFIEYTCTDR